MAKNRLFLLILVTCLGLVACSSEELAGEDALTGEITFRSVDEIIDQELDVTSFGNDGSARLPIRTTVPVACTVVYGTTPEFGSLSLDLDMEGGTHSDHSPFLSGLEAETDYFFRVQGVDDNGIVYLSDTMTFTTPAFEAPTTENLASLAKGAEIVGFSSAFGDAGIDDRWGAASAFDDNPNSEWSSAGDGDEAWVEVRLAGKARIDAVEFQSRAMSDGSAIAQAFSVVTESGESYGPFELPGTDSRYTFDVSFEAETLRFNLMKTTGGNTGAVDIAVYGELSGD